MVLNILDYVWENQDELGGLIGHMLNAQPDDFLNSGGLGCPIAQKYGYETYSGTLHVAVAGNSLRRRALPYRPSSPAAATPP